MLEGDIQPINPPNKKFKQASLNFFAIKNQPKSVVESVSPKLRTEFKKRKHSDTESPTMLKKKKAMDKFQSFFTKTRTSPTAKAKPTQRSNFMPFELKENMKLSPLVRRYFGSEQKSQFDASFISQAAVTLYIEQIKEPDYDIGSMGRTWNKETGSDLIIVGPSAIKSHHAKFLYFHENNRPPYYGTWSKRSRILNARNPFNKDTDMLDYEVDSDDEWEEEEPGESLSHSEGEDKNEEKEGGGDDDEEEAGWMVPHGYLSAGEGCEDDEEVTVESMKMRQKAKQEAWETELKRKHAPVLPEVVGCCWEKGEEHVIVNKDFLIAFQVCTLLTFPIDTTHSGPNPNEPSDPTVTTPTSSRQRPQSAKQLVTEQAMPHLIRLIHGNTAGSAKLIAEFRRQWSLVLSGKQEHVTRCSPTAGGDRTDSDPVSPGPDAAGSGSGLDVSGLDGSGPECKNDDVDDKINTIDADVKFADTIETEGQGDESNNCGISKTQLKMKITAIAVREKRANYRKICWYVHKNILDQYNLTDLPLPTDDDLKTPQRGGSVSPSPRCNTPTQDLVKNNQPSITKFATKNFTNPFLSPAMKIKPVKLDTAFTSPESVNAPAGWLAGETNSGTGELLDVKASKPDVLSNEKMPKFSPLAKFFIKSEKKSETIATKINVDKILVDGTKNSDVIDSCAVDAVINSCAVNSVIDPCADVKKMDVDQNEDSRDSDVIMLD